jgi:leader peptidase (prepilin peptidase)/N-methyltransferase
VSGPAAAALPTSPMCPSKPASAPKRSSARWLIPPLLAALTFGVCLRLHPALVAAAGSWLTLCGVPLAFVDARVRRLPDVLTLTCCGGLAVLLTAAAGLDDRWASLLRAGIGAVAVAGMFLLLALARPGSAGLGDAKLGLSTGALAGWFGWGVLLQSVFAAFLLAAAVGLVLIAARRATLRAGSLPFGPFLLAGCLAAVLLAGGSAVGR